RTPELLRVLDDLAMGGHPASYHFGVVTSDLGAGMAVNGGCMVGGLGGRLQALGRAHGANCEAPTGGLNFLVYDQITQTDNLPVGVPMADELSCMGEVGSAGCGYEHVLESVYRALHDCETDATCTIPENLGFLRRDALLVVIFVTDEDDCSAPPDTDLFDSN